jgi:hypothetical protein
MSLTGMAVETDATLKVGRTYALTLRHGEEPALRLAGAVIWCHLRGVRRDDGGDSKTVYEAGIRFEEALSDQTARLAQMLGATAIVTVEKRVSGRFKVNVPEPVSVASDHDFLVRTISTVGLLVETEASAAPSSMVEIELDLQGAVLRSRGRVAHVRRVDGGDGGDGVKNQLGIEFVGTSERERRTIEEFVAGHLGSYPGPGH